MMMNKFFTRRIVSALISTAICCGLLLPLAGCGNDNAGEVNEFSYWVATSESTEYYLNYEENPVLKYILQNKTFKDKNGKDAGLNFKIQHPPTGKEWDNLNTMISTGSYPDILDTTFGGQIEEWYRDGVLLDLTDYVENSMPNYKKYIDEHPELIDNFTKIIDGERKYLQIVGVSDIIDADALFAGFCYRRDWIVKYGVQPDTLFDPMSGETAKANANAGQSFSGYYSLDKEGNEVRHEKLQDDTDGESWVDNVVFPSGNYHPVYISDWEWMFDIFTEAIAAEQIAGGYVLSLYYPGYVSNGELVTAFGGGSPIWYLNNQTNQFTFGAVTDDFKTYLQAMNNWWQKGWIDQQFSERSGDVFYRIDETSFRSGKVGLWIGASGNLDSRLNNPDQPFTDGIVVFGAAQPINDIYGSDEQKLKIPYTMYQPLLVGGGITITDKAKDKDITLLLNFVDYLYSDEGALLRTMGLNAEQAAQAKDPFYEKHGLTEGSYLVDNREGQPYYLFVKQLLANADLKGAATGAKLPGRKANAFLDLQFGSTHKASRENWVKYPATGFKYYSTTAILSSEQQRDISKIATRVGGEYMEITVPQFIKGEKNFEVDWETYVADLKKRNYQAVTDLLNAAIGK